MERTRRVRSCRASSALSVVTRLQCMAEARARSPAGAMTVKGKSTSLSQFYRLGGKIMGMIFKHATEAAPPEPREVEEEFWKLVIDRDSHVVVHQV